MNHKRIAGALSVILIAYGAVMLLPMLFALVDSEFKESLPFLLAAVISVVVGLFCRRVGSGEKSFDDMKRTEGLLIVTLTWWAASLVGGLPYLFFGLSPLDALFESASGLTTTGATILTDFSLYPRAFYFWRSLTQWLGGLGIIVLFVAVLPQFGVAGRQIFFAEAPGPVEDKMTPRIAHTAKGLWLVYLLLTVVETAALMAAGLPFYDALCNALTTLSAGGFSPNPESILGYHNSAVTWIIAAFMFFAGANFTLQYQLLFRRRLRPLLRSEELRLYVGIVVCATALLTLLLVGDCPSFVDALRDALFQVLSLLTTAGFSSVDFALWPVPALAVLLAMMCIGGCAGSAGGGVKVVRILFVWRWLKREIALLVHPRAVLPMKLDRETTGDEVQRQLLSFLLFYLMLTLLSGLVVSIIEHDFAIGFVGTLVTIGNVGPGFGEIGPMGTFGGLHVVSKLLFIVDMIAGRLELIPFLIMLTPEFWRFATEKQ